MYHCYWLGGRIGSNICRCRFGFVRFISKAVFTGPWQLTVSSWPGSRLSFFTVSTKEISWVFTNKKLPKTNMSPVKVGLFGPKRKVFKPSFCRAYVSFREGMMHMCIKSCMEIAFFFFKNSFSHWTWIIYNGWGLCRWCASCFFPCIVLRNPSQGSWTRWFGVGEKHGHIALAVAMRDQVHMARARKMRKRFHSCIIQKWSKLPSELHQAAKQWPKPRVLLTNCRTYL